MICRTCTAGLLLFLACVTGWAAPPSIAGIEAHVGITIAKSDVARLQAALHALAQIAPQGTLAVATTPAGRVIAAHAGEAGLPTAASRQALERCELTRRTLASTFTRPCELVWANDGWIDTAASLQAHIGDFSAAPVWRIEGDRGVVYLAGSVHALKPAFYPMPPAFEQAFAQSDRLALELNPLRAGEPDRRAAMGAAMTAAPEQVRQALGEKRIAALTPLLARHGVALETALGLKPAMLAAQLSVMELASLGFAPDQGIDLHYARRATAAGKPILELETTEEQMQALAGSPLDAQALLLDQSLAQYRDLQANVNELIRAWLSGDGQTLYRLMTRDFHGSKVLEHLGVRLLDERNFRMAEQVERWLHEPGTTFVIVGAGHFGGPKGLLQLLTERGYALVQSARNGTPLEPEQRGVGRGANQGIRP